MAIPENRTTFKIGDKTYLYDDFANFYNTYKLSYYDYARERGGFSQELINQLDAEIAKALDLARNSGEFDTTGDFNGNNIQNITVTKKRLGKDKEIQQGLTGKNSWLTNFIAKAGQHMNEYTEDKPNLDFNNYTLGAYLRGTGQNAELIFSSYDKAPNEDAIDGRKFIERGKPTYDFLTGYRNFLKSTDFDFTNDNNIYNDNHMTILDNAIKMFENDNGEYIFDNLDYDKSKFNINQLTLYLNLLGANLGGDYDYTRALTSDRYKYPTEEEIAKMNTDKEAEAKRKRSEDIETTKRNWAQEFFDLGNTSPGNEIILNTFRNFDDFNNYYEWYFGTHRMDSNHLVNGAKLSKNNLGSTFNDLTKFLRTGTGSYTYSNNDKKILLQLAFDSDLKDNIFLNLNDKNYYLINDTINDNGWGYAYNPTTGGLKPVFLGNYTSIPEINTLYNELRKNYLSKQYKDHEYFSEIFPSQAPLLKKGGLIKKYKWGDPIDFGSYEEDLRLRAQENNKSVRELKEGERYLSEKNKSEENPNAGFTYNDIWSLANIGINLGSMIADPVTGLFLGATSSTSEFINEIARDGFQWKDAGNWVKSLGMDAVGVLPVIGDKLGTLNKSKQILFKFVPTMLAVLGTTSSVKNTPQIIDSLSKIIDDRPMTVDDWRNVAEGINLIVTGSNFGKGILKTRKARQKTNNSKALQIEVENDLGEKKLLIVDGEDAANIRNANKEKGIEGVNEEIHKLKNIENPNLYNAIVDNSKWKNYEWRGLFGDNVDTGSSGNLQFPIARTKDQARIQVYRDPVQYARIYLGEKAAKRVENRIDKNEKYIGATLENKLTEAQNQINKEASELARQSDIEAYLRRILPDKIQERINTEQSNKTNTEKSLKSFNNLKNKIKKSENQIASWEEMASKNSANESFLRPKIEKEKANLSKLRKKFNKNYQQDSGDKLNSEINRLNKLINDLVTRKNRFTNNIHSSAYNKLKDFKKKTVNIYGRNYNIYPTKVEYKTPENDYSIDYSYLSELLNYPDFHFKQGGSINRNKLNKFLNYGKR